MTHQQEHNPSVVDTINERQSGLCGVAIHEAAIVYCRADQGIAKQEYNSPLSVQDLPDKTL
jgi:hypothetical protein